MNVSKIPPVWVLLGLTALLYGLWPSNNITILGCLVGVYFIELGWEAQVVDWSLLQISPL